MTRLAGLAPLLLASVCHAVYTGKYFVRDIYGQEDDATLEMFATGDWNGRAGRVLTLSVSHEQDLQVLSSARSGLSVLSLQGTVMGEVLNVTSGTLWEHPLPPTAAARVQRMVAVLQVLVVRVIANDASTTATMDELRDYVFDGANTLLTQIAACSYNQQTIIKYPTGVIGTPGLTITDGARAPHDPHLCRLEPVYKPRARCTCRRSRSRHLSRDCHWRYPRGH